MSSNIVGVWKKFRAQGAPQASSGLTAAEQQYEIARNKAVKASDVNNMAAWAQQNRAAIIAANTPKVTAPAISVRTKSPMVSQNAAGNIAAIAKLAASSGNPAAVLRSYSPVVKVNLPQTTISATTAAQKKHSVPLKSPTGYYASPSNTGISDLTPSADLAKSAFSGITNALSAPASAARLAIPIVTGKINSVTNPDETKGYYSTLQALSDLSGTNIDKKIQSVPVAGTALDVIANILADTATDPTTYAFGSGLGSAAKRLSKLGKAADFEEAMNTASSVKRAAELADSSKMLSTGQKAAAAGEAATKIAPFYENGEKYTSVGSRNFKNLENLVATDPQTAIETGAKNLWEQMLPETSQAAARAEAAVSKAETATPVLKSDFVDTTGRIVSGRKTVGQKVAQAVTPTAGKPHGIVSTLNQRLVDVLAPIKQFSKEAKVASAAEDPYIAASNASNAGGTSRSILQQGLADREGNIVGKSFKEIVSQIPKKLQKDFENYLLNKHNISRMAEGKPVFGADVTADVSKANVAQYEKLHPEFKQASADLQNWWRSFVNEWGVKSGLIDADTQKMLQQKYPDYVPTYRQFLDIERGSGVKNAPSKFVNVPNALKKAVGSDRSIIEPLQSMTQLVQNMVKASRYNDVGQLVYKALKKNPEGLQKWAQILPDNEIPKVSDALKSGNLEEGVDELLQQWQQALKDKTRQNIVRVMVDGKPQYIQINDSSFLRALTGMEAQPSAVEKGFRKLTGGFKALITGDNPLFALRNIARDVPTAYVNGSEHNPVKFAGNLIKAGKELVTNGDVAKEYGALGGGGGGFFRQDLQSLSKRPGPLSGIRKFNELTEQTPRLAEYIATKNKLGNTAAGKAQALFNANDVTTNFARHGDIVKSIDSFVPYLNPGVQGLAKEVKQLVTHPVGTIAKGVAAITLPTAALDAINWNNPNYQALDNRTKDNYFLIPNPADSGKTFIKLPKSRELGVLFGSLFERVTRAALGEKDAFKGFGNTVATNIAPNNPLESNFLSPVLTNIPSNKDFANRTIVPASLQNLSPRYQYDESTSEIAKAIGDKMNLSPKQIDYLINAYGGVIAQLGLPLTTKSTYNKGNAVGNVTSPIVRSYTSDPLYSNQALQDFYNNLQTAKNNSADQKFLGQSSYNAKDVYAYMTKAQSSMQDIQKQINTLDPAQDASKISALRRQMISTAQDANNYMGGNRSGDQIMQSRMTQYGYQKKDTAAAAKDEITKAVQTGNLNIVNGIAQKYGLTKSAEKSYMRSATSQNQTAKYPEIIRKYLNLGKLNRLQFYNSMSATDRAAFRSTLAQYGLEP